MKYEHYCAEWDDMLIDETCQEIACCMCFNNYEFNEYKQKMQDRIRYETHC